MLQSALVTVLAPCSIKLLLVVATLTTLAELYAILAMGPAQPDRARHIVSNVVIRILILYTQYGNMSTTQNKPRPQHWLVHGFGLYYWATDQLKFCRCRFADRNLSRRPRGHV
jgi:hypothetical protein